MRQVLTSVIVSFALAGSVLAGGCSSAGTTDEDAGSTLSDAAAADAADGAQVAPNADCDAFCAKVTALACSAAGSCKADCQKQIAQTPSQCSAEVLALISCSANEGKVVGCDSKGKGKIEGCNAQLSTYANCLLGGGGSADAGGPRCSEITTGNTACDQCMDKSCCNEESACAASPDCIAFDACITKGTARATCESDHPRGRDLSAASLSCRARSCQAACP